jgi:hypothetical protein
MRSLFATVRIVFAILGAAAVIATFASTAAVSAINPFNFFGYFTIQSNIAFVVVLAVVAIVGFTGRRQSGALYLIRGCVATYMIIVGIVYNTLLTNVDVSIHVPWANTVLHTVLPIYALVDWLIFADRPPLAWNRYWVVLVYPVVWLVVVLIRVGTDGFFFYPFLNFRDPKLGGGGVAIYCVIIAVAFALFGLAVWGISRLRILTPKGAVAT